MSLNEARELSAQVSPISPELLERAPARGPGLLERDGVLRELHAVLARAHGGVGAGLLIEGHAGTGKTAVLKTAAEQARPLGLLVVHTAAAEPERSLAFGLAGHIVRRLVAALPQAERDAALAAAPARLHAIAGVSAPEEDGQLGSELTVAHGLFALAAAAAERRPLLIAIDDLQWADEASMRCVLYLAHRLDSLAVALVATSRPGGAGRALDQLAAHPPVRVHALAPLSREAVGKVVAAWLGSRPEPELIDACHEASAGNPTYLHALVSELSEGSRAEEPLLAHARDVVPAAITRALRLRVDELGPDAVALARAVAIFASDTPLRQAAALAGLDHGRAAAAADALGAIDVLATGEPLRFAHPLARRAVYADIAPAERAGAHLQAARLLEADDADPEQVAAHLLAGRPAGDTWAVAQLRRAARAALRSGDPAVAVRYLRRAVQEPPAREQRVEILVELGSAELAAAQPAAVEHLAQALEATESAHGRAELGLTLGRALTAQGLHERAAETYEQALGELPSDPADAGARALRDELQTGFLAAAVFVPGLHQRAHNRLASLLARPGAGRDARLALAQAASQACIGASSPAHVRELCDRAWADGLLLSQDAQDGSAWTLLAAALTMSGELERCLELTERLRERAGDALAPVARASAAFARSLPLLWQGRVSDAMAELEQARDARSHGWQRFRRAAAAVCALCLLETGEVDLAESALGDEPPLQPPLDLEEFTRAHVLARVRLAQGQAQQALELALRVGEAITGMGVAGLPYAPWRETAAEAHLALGQPQPARLLAQQASALAEASGIAHERIRSLRVLALCETGPARLALLRTASRLGADAPPRLESIRADIELGAALRRANRRTEAREPLQRAADRAQRGGATVLYERARTELAATGARPRREVLLHGAQALTASERRIAELAAAGQSNREIAQTLFVTAKTVEYHLRNAYRKLDIETRRELPGALGRQVPTSAVVVSVPRGSKKR